MTYTLPANSDSFFAIPLQRPAVYSGTVVSVAGNTVNLSGTPNWTANQFAYAQGVQNSTFYCIIGSGSKKGAFYTVIANGSDSLTLEPNGESLADIAAGTPVNLIPYWTLSELLPASSGFPASPTFTPVAEVVFIAVNSPGINLASDSQYFYYSGTAAGGAGWRRVGQSFTSKFDNIVIYPDTPVRIRNSTSAQAAFTVTGIVPIQGHRSIIGTITPSVPQDNYVAIATAADTTLIGTALHLSSAFSGSPTFTPVDELTLFDNAVSGFNKSPSSSYFYYTGTAAGGPGWRRVGDSFINIYNTLPILAGSGFIIRKSPAFIPQDSVWAFTPAYAN